MSYFKDSKNGLHFLDNLDFAHLLPADCVSITDKEAKTIQAENEAAQAAENAPAVLKVTAQTALDKSDVTLIRCAENGVVVPLEWAAYRKALRSVISGAASIMPTQPAYPAGT